MARKHQPTKTAPKAGTKGAKPIRTGTAPKSLFSDALLCSNMGKGLRAEYMELLREPLPQNLIDALKKIDGGRK
jgi:hypothetical protein